MWSISRRFEDKEQDSSNSTMARKSKEDSFSCPQGLPLTLVSLIHVLAGFCFRAPVLTKASSSDICANFYDQEKKKKKLHSGNWRNTIMAKNQPLTPYITETIIIIKPNFLKDHLKITAHKLAIR